MKHPFGLKLRELEAFWRSRSLGPISQSRNTIQTGSEESSEPIATTLALGEEGGGTIDILPEDDGVLTTQALGEEGGVVTTDILSEDGGVATTQALGEEGGVGSTEAFGEEGGVVTTDILSEDGSVVTTQALGEEGGATTDILFEGGGVGGVITEVVGEGGEAPLIAFERGIHWEIRKVVGSLATALEAGAIDPMEKILPLKLPSVDTPGDVSLFGDNFGLGGHDR